MLMLQLHLSAPFCLGEREMVYNLQCMPCIEVNEIDKQKIMIKGQKINMADKCW